MPPRRVPLSAQQYEEAVSLLAELLLEVAAKRRAVASGGVTGGASDGVIGSVTPFPQKRREGREAA
ncbi:MAG: hypothetical protein ACRDLM_06175 [Gaiellaceae bacterium]